MGGNPSLFDFKKLLTTPLRRPQFMLDLAQACNQVIGKEVEERRRRLEHSRDSVKNRKGQTVSWFDYLPEDDKPAYDLVTGEPVENLKVGEAIPNAKVLRAISNIGIRGEESATDYLEVEFTTKQGRKARWLMPMSAPQERSLLLSNAYMLGFDFYNTTLSDEDYQRLYEYLNMFWPENGMDDKFIQFIGFIKNLKLSLEPLWSQDNRTDDIRILEEINETRQKITDKGDWYLTSHVAIHYNIREQNSIYPIDLDEIERLFYLFAPIMLVLERIVGEIDVLIDMYRVPVPVADVVNYGIGGLDYDIYIDHLHFAVTDVSITNYGIYTDGDYAADPDDMLDISKYYLNETGEIVYILI